MTIQMLECFLTAARLNSFSQAADELYMSQPTLSRTISALEAELEVSLFLRAKNTVRLSDMGLLLHDRLQALYQTHLAATGEIQKAIRAYDGCLRIGVQETIPLPEALTFALRELDDPGKVLFRTVDLDQGYTMLSGGTVDLLLSLDVLLPEMEALESLTLSTEQMCLAVPASHPNAGLQQIAYDEILQYFGDMPLKLSSTKLLEPPVMSALNAQMDRFSIAPEYIMQPEYTLNTLRLLVEAQLAVSFFTENSTLADCPQVKLIPLYQRQGRQRLPQRTRLCAFWLKYSNNAALRQLVGLLKKAARAERSL